MIDAPEIVAFASWLDSFNVYTFAMISGYLFYFLKMENQHYPTFKKFIQSKLHRLILPAYSVSFLWVIPLSLLFYSMSCTTIFKKYFLMNGPSQLWFLVMLFDVFILGWVVRYFVQKSNIGSILLGGCSFAIAVLGLHYNLNYFMIFTGFMYFPVFLFGFKIRQYKSILLYKIPIIVLFLLEILWFAGNYYMQSQVSGIYKCFWIVSMFGMHLLGAFAAFSILVRASIWFHWNEKSFFTTVGSKTMLMYLLHQQIIYFFIHAFNGILVPEIHVFITFIGTLAISLLLANIILRCRFLKWLTGC